tara:strand:+ start:1780 stop:2490 length:711 start_codon:yes stop_codon:yes gene_type:complete
VLHFSRQTGVGTLPRFEKLIVDYPNSPASGGAVSRYPDLIVNPRDSSSGVVYADDDTMVNGRMATLEISASVRRHVFGLPVGLRANRGFSAMAAWLAIYRLGEDEPMMDGIITGIWMSSGELSESLSNGDGQIDLDPGEKATLALVAINDADSSIIPIGMMDGKGPVLNRMALDVQAIEIQVLFRAAGINKYCGFSLENSDKGLRVRRDIDPKPGFAHFVRRVEPGYNRSRSEWRG